MTIASPRQTSIERLGYHYAVIHATILSKQNPASGLMPASSHGNYTDAWVRDNVYSIYAVYGLALAYRRIDDDSGRAFELEHAVIKLMRGLLFAMMRQAHKVEQFKKTQTLDNALHAKYNTETGETVVGDFEWGHLQIDATSIFLVALADMTTSGLMMIYTRDEVDFIQNLVFYIERTLGAYRTPDYGIWERGNKINHGQPELNSSSIGMAVAALRAINGINLFGPRGGPSSIIHVLPDELTRNVTTLHSFLPRESNSKEIDGSVLSIIGFPAFACSDMDLIRRTKEEARLKLEGRYGWKRFLRDGHQTELEDTSRLYYDANELKQFEHIESEWPLFFTYLVLDGLFTGNIEQVEYYRQKLEPLIIDSKLPSSLVSSRGSTPSSPAAWTAPLTVPLIPELYFVPRDKIEAEKSCPNSQTRVPNDNLPLVWANSLYFLGNLMYEGLLSPSEVDPLNRSLNSTRPPKDSIVQIVLLSEDEALQNTLSLYGLETQTMDQISSTLTVLPAHALADVYAGLGMNSKLKMSGRPKRPIGVLGTSRLYRIEGHVYAFTPHFMDNDEFYLNSDPDYLVSAFESELLFTSKHWFYPGRPTIVVLLSHALLGTMRTLQLYDSSSSHNTSTQLSRKNLLNFFMQLRGGTCNGVRVRLSRLSETINTSNIESLDFLISKPDLDWKSILLAAHASRQKTIHRKLGYSETMTQANTPGHKTPKRQSSTFQQNAFTSPINPLDDSHFQELSHALTRLASTAEPPFRLKDHEIVSTYIVDHSFYTCNFAMLALILGDPTQFNEAIQSLEQSVNLYDQIDLLQYLISCESLESYIEVLDATLRELLEEVYLKSRRLQYWSIARQAAGLLHKNVPSLTINITDLIIRQKQISIGSGAGEYLISTPVGPEALNAMLAEHCTEDVREGPLVQEILIYLGSFIRTQPDMFDGILRLRTHHIIIALREEVRRMNHCDEEEAVEQLLQLSPFELKSLLATILSPHLCDVPSMSTPERRRLSIASLQAPESSSSIPIPVQEDVIVIRAQSGGYLDGNLARADINGMVLTAEGRGVHVWCIDPEERMLTEHASFDTHISEDASESFSKCLEAIKPGFIVIVACKDDMAEHITSSALFSLEALGSEKIRDVRHRDSFVFINKKGGSRKDMIEVHAPAGKGPTIWIEKQINTTVDTSNITADNINTCFPHSNGKWHHRRKNDGALNRVPPHFFPDTWKLLDRSQGLKINDHRLLRDPTVLEMTAEEFNFALAVEGFLGWYSDPAERQIAVETLTVMAKVQQRNPEMKTMEAMIDLPLIMNTAIRIFWEKWVYSSHRLQKCPLLAQGPEYERHRELAARLFYDLPQQGTESTFSYLARAILKALPFEFDYNESNFL
ncbi:glycosyl hydrolases family 15-domain-containing protein [Phycomyces nitens]|nr:glycosyl hydrolases family 15-domain-containing protein [Phycomyces nitens]